MKEKKEVTYAKNQDLYTRIKKEDCKFIFRKKMKVKFSFDQFIMALDYLFIIGAIKKNERGLLCYEAAQSEGE